MSFREENYDYLRLREAWLKSVDSAYMPKVNGGGGGWRVAQLDSVMLASYRLHKCIKNYLRSGVEDSISTVCVPLFPTAIKNARRIIEYKKYPEVGLPGLFHEADVLEALSRACFRYLKTNNKLKSL